MGKYPKNASVRINGVTYKTGDNISNEAAKSITGNKDWQVDGKFVVSVSAKEGIAPIKKEAN